MSYCPGTRKVSRAAREVEEAQARAALAYRELRQMYAALQRASRALADLNPDPPALVLLGGAREAA